MSIQEEQEVFRPNVGLMIVNREGKLWLGQRRKVDHIEFNQQMPQGGIDSGETPEQAAFRELREETGLKKEKVQLLKETSDWYSYVFPKPKLFGDKYFVGQRQKWFLFLLTGNDSDFDLETYPEEVEFTRFDWYPIDQVLDRIVPFKREVYRQVLENFEPDIMQIARQHTPSDPEFGQMTND